jgi:hypothetical protein
MLLRIHVFCDVTPFRLVKYLPTFRSIYRLDPEDKGAVIPPKLPLTIYQSTRRRISEDLISSPSVVGGMHTRTQFRVFFLPTTNQATVKKFQAGHWSAKLTSCLHVATLLSACLPFPSASYVLVSVNIWCERCVYLNCPLFCLQTVSLPFVWLLQHQPRCSKTLSQSWR